MILRNGKFSEKYCGKFSGKFSVRENFSMENFPPHITNISPSAAVEVD
jgi:hypothetical protein